MSFGNRVISSSHCVNQCGRVPLLLIGTVLTHSRCEEILEMVGSIMILATDIPHNFQVVSSRESAWRALASKQEALLMDELFGALDPITRVDLQDEFKRIQRNLNLTVIMVTHDMTEAY